jgi:hypothetical protein
LRFIFHRRTLLPEAARCRFDADPREKGRASDRLRQAQPADFQQRSFERHSLLNKTSWRAEIQELLPKISLEFYENSANIHAFPSIRARNCANGRQMQILLSEVQ